MLSCMAIPLAFTGIPPRSIRRSPGGFCKRRRPADGCFACPGSTWLKAVRHDDPVARVRSYLLVSVCFRYMIVLLYVRLVGLRRTTALSPTARQMWHGPPGPTCNTHGRPISCAERNRIKVYLAVTDYDFKNGNA